MQKLVVDIEERYRLVEKIGEGGYALVYEGIDLKTNEGVALKLERHCSGRETLSDEARVYGILAGQQGIPRVRWFGEECSYDVLALDLLGPSLEDLFNYCGGRFSLKTVLLLADQLITRIESIHSKSILHRDIKPSNILMGTGRQGNVVHVVDFGVAEMYRPERGGAPNAGTERFGSINFHKITPHHKGDDLESLGYCFLRQVIKATCSKPVEHALRCLGTPLS